MPELPEVETTRLGIAPRVTGRSWQGAEVRERRLRWPVPARLDSTLSGARIDAVERRGKYLLFRSAKGCLIVHLGMSGSLRLVKRSLPLSNHDHVDLLLPRGVALRFHDPRRFGAILWTRDEPLNHPLLRHLGPEPLEAEFTADYLCSVCRRRRVPIKNLIMNSRVVVGVGNIYASEALFRAGIRPTLSAKQLSESRCEHLVAAIQEVLTEAIAQRGTTLRDYVQSSGEQGYFALKLNVYGKEGVPCPTCGTPITQKRLGQRATYWCSRCQQ